MCSQGGTSFYYFLFPCLHSTYIVLNLKRLFVLKNIWGLLEYMQSLLKFKCRRRIPGIIIRSNRNSNFYLLYYGVLINLEGVFLGKRPVSSGSFSYSSKFPNQSFQLRVAGFLEGSLQEFWGGCYFAVSGDRSPASFPQPHTFRNPFRSQSSSRKRRTSLAVPESLWLPPVLHDLEAHLNVPLVCKQLHRLLEEAKLVALPWASLQNFLNFQQTSDMHILELPQWLFFKIESTWNGFLPGNGWSFSPIFFRAKELITALPPALPSFRD